MVAEGERRNEVSRPIRMAKQYVMQHFQEPITLEEVCEAAGFSASYFSSLFKNGNRGGLCQVSDQSKDGGGQNSFAGDEPSCG